MRTSNPALNAKTFERFGPGAVTGEAMTIEGAVNRTAFLLLLLAATATWTWSQTFAGVAVEGYLLGGIFGVLAALLLAYRSGLIPVTEKFRMGVVAATGGIAIFYLVAMGLSFFNITIPFLHEGSALGIAFSLFVVVIAALNLVLDFDFIQQGAQQGAPKVAEWYAAFGLIVTLVWLYLEILRLLSKLRSR